MPPHGLHAEELVYLGHHGERPGGWRVIFAFGKVTGVCKEEDLEENELGVKRNDSFVGGDSQEVQLAGFNVLEGFGLGSLFHSSGTDYWVNIDVTCVIPTCLLSWAGKG